MALIHVRPRRFTVDEYERLCNHGVLRPDERTELIEGEIVPRMSQNPPHVAGIILGTEALMQAFGTTHKVGVQVTAKLTPWSAPDPDFMLLSQSQWSHSKSITTADLVVEVADTTLEFDRDEKASLYALANLPEYWIVNLVDRQIEVHREPGPSPSAPYGAAYGSRSVYGVTDSLSPLCRPDARIRVADFLPAASEQP